MLDGSVKHVHEEQEGLVDRLVAEGDTPLSALVADGPRGIGGGLDALALDHLLAAVLIEERDRDRGDLEGVEERQQVLAQRPLVVRLRRGPQLRLAGELPRRREPVERRVRHQLTSSAAARRRPGSRQGPVRGSARPCAWSSHRRRSPG